MFMPVVGKGLRRAVREYKVSRLDKTGVMDLKAGQKLNTANFAVFI